MRRVEERRKGEEERGAAGRGEERIVEEGREEGQRRGRE